MQSIIEPQTKPASEWICGRIVQKVSPQERHSRAQRQVTIALSAWADRFGTGRVGPEWEFRIAPPGEAARTLVPDVAYLSYERIAYDDDAAAQMPAVAPNVVFEILSPNDRRRYVEEKLRVYLSSGTELVVLVDPLKQTAALHDMRGLVVLHAGEMFSHPALPHFRMPVAQIFAKPPQPRR